MEKKVMYLLLFGVILSLVSFIFDAQISVFVSSLRNFSLDYVLIGIAFASNAVIIFFFLTSLFLWREHKRKWILPLWFVLGLSVLVSYILKILIYRPRPFQAGVISVLGIGVYLMKESFLTWNFSFPSFQAMLVFSALPILDKEFPKFKYIWFVFACLVAVSRVYFGLHYMSDVIAGAVIGYALGMIVVFAQERYKIGEKIMKKLRIKK